MFTQRYEPYNRDGDHTTSATGNHDPAWLRGAANGERACLEQLSAQLLRVTESDTSESLSLSRVEGICCRLRASSRARDDGFRLDRVEELVAEAMHGDLSAFAWQLVQSEEATINRLRRFERDSWPRPWAAGYRGPRLPYC